MECLITFCIFGFLFLFLSVIARGASKNNKWNRAYNMIASKYGGEWTASGVFGRPSARIRYGATHCFISNIRTRTRGGGPFTQVAINWPDPGFRMELFPKWRTNNKIWGFPGMSEVSVTTRDFDERYFIRSNDVTVAQTLLSEGVCWQIDRLRSFLDMDDVYITVQRGLMTIKKPSFIRLPEELDDYLRYCLELFDQGMLTRVIGIDFVNDQETGVLEDVSCQICGDLIAGDLVFCLRCKTPHCRECWHYYGQCSTYGCGETRYNSPKVAVEVASEGEGSNSNESNGIKADSNSDSDSNV